MMKTVIIGAGPAGVSAAETLSKFGKGTGITMITAEPFPPYSPPAMVDYFLHGGELHLWKGSDFAEKLQINYKSGYRVIKVDPDEQTIQLHNGEKLLYDRLLLAAGARLYAPLEGADKEGIHNFKSLLAGEKLLALVRSGEVKSALIVGAGFIGVEIALLLNKLGLAVTMLVRSRVMRGMLDPETAALVGEMLTEQGIKVIGGHDADATAFTGSQTVKGVLMRSGKELTADLIVAATGLKPNLEFLKGSDIETDWGVIVDPYLQTNRHAVYAAGDICETEDRISGRRYSHANFPNARAQGVVAARNMLGHKIEYAGADSINSLKHLGLPIAAAGLIEGEELRARGPGYLRKLWIKDDRLVGFRLTGEIRNAGIFLSLMRNKTRLQGLEKYLLDHRFGMGIITNLALDPAAAETGNH